MSKKILCIALLSGFVFVANAQEQDSVKRTAPARAGAALQSGVKAKPKDYDDVITKKAISQWGMITTHKVEDKFYFEINDTTLNRDILVVSRIAKSGADLRDIQGYAGDQIGGAIIRFEKGPNNHIFMRKISYRTYSPDSTTAMYQSVKNSTLQAIAASWNIAAFSEDKKSSVIDVTDYLNADNDILYFSSAKGKSNLMLGAQQADRSYINSVRSFPQNVEVSVVKTYAKVAPPANSNASSRGAAPSGAVTLMLNASMVLLPKEPMKARHFDERVGYFAVGYKDFDLNPQGVKDVELVKRWRLEPKPADMAKYKRGELVEPAKQIVFYIDPATPKKWIPYLIAGVNDWQKAFEKAGFKNAIIGKEAPTFKQDSTWSLDDARHSAIVYKPSEIANASGPSISDPRSGEIIESHINWYHNVMKLVHDWYMIQTAAVDKRARSMNFSDELMGDLIRFVSSHEVGHTLGLRHNYGSSSTVPVEKLRDKQWVEANGHTPSIMDYARFNYVAQPEDNIGKTGLYPRIGDYDKWAIEWGYKYFPENRTVEADMRELNKMTAEAANNKRLWFGTETNNDDPREQNEDLGDNAMVASTYGLKNLKVILTHLNEWTKQSGEGYNDLNNMYNQLTTQYMRYIGHVAKNVGGIEETPKTTDQLGPIYVRTNAQRQEQAVEWLNLNVFETPKWLLNQQILDRINANPLDVVARLQQVALGRLASSHTLGKLVSAEAQDGAQAYKATDLLKQLDATIFSELGTGKAIDVYRRNLQKLYVDRLTAIVKPQAAQNNIPSGRGADLNRSSANGDVISVTRATLHALAQRLPAAAGKQSDSMSKYHLQDLESRIREALDRKD